MNDCPSEATLLRLLENNLPLWRRRAPLWRHVHNCASCRESVKLFARVTFDGLAHAYIEGCDGLAAAETAARLAARALRMIERGEVRKPKPTADALVIGLALILTLLALAAGALLIYLTKG
jgi:hypothetical protein